MKRRWTEADVKKLSGRVRGMQPGKQIRVRIKAKQVAEMEQVLSTFNIPFQTEYRFHDKRKFRFDIALVEHKVAIEYEGIMANKSRHTNVVGYTTDADKYNLAQCLGWRVLRYTALNYHNLLSNLQQLGIV